MNTPQSADTQDPHATTQNTPDQESVPYMTSMATCMNKLVLDGYVDTFKVTEQGLHSLKEDRYFSPDQVKVLNFFRFEGVSDPADNTILYQIQTADGLRGMLVDAYGPYADAGVSGFMQQVEDMEKKNPKKAG